MRLKRVDHIGVVVDDLAEAADLLSRGFGLSLGTTLERDQLRAQFYRCGDVSIELIEIVGP